LIYPFDVVDVEEPVEIVSTDNRGGNILKYKIKYCKHYDVPGKVIVELIDGEVHFFDTIYTSVDKGCGEFISNRIVIPENITPGTYKLKVTIIHQMTILREVSQSFYSNYFWIYPKKDSSL